MTPEKHQLSRSAIGPHFEDGLYEDLRFGNSFPNEIESLALPYWCASAIKIWNDRDDSRFLQRIKVIQSYVEELCRSSHFFIEHTSILLTPSYFTGTLEDLSYFSNRLHIPFTTKINGQDVMYLALEEAFSLLDDFAASKHYPHLARLLEHIARVLISVHCFFPTKPGSWPNELSHVLPPSIQLAFQQTMQILLRFNLHAVDIERKTCEGLDSVVISLEADSLILETYMQLLEQDNILFLFAKFSDHAQVSSHPSAYYICVQFGVYCVNNFQDLQMKFDSTFLSRIMED